MTTQNKQKLFVRTRVLPTCFSIFSMASAFCTWYMTNFKIIAKTNLSKEDKKKSRSWTTQVGAVKEAADIRVDKLVAQGIQGANHSLVIHRIPLRLLHKVDYEDHKKVEIREAVMKVMPNLTLRKWSMPSKKICFSILLAINAHTKTKA